MEEAPHWRDALRRVRGHDRAWPSRGIPQKRSKLKVVLDNVQFLSTRGSGGAGGGGGGGAAPSDEGGPASIPDRSASGGRPAPAAGKDHIDEDVPF